MEWRAAIYGRVSTEHEEQQESIKVQKDALIKFAKDNMIYIAGCYFDEGYTGTNFERPELLRLKTDIEKGLVNLLIIKDLSRLGRNNVMTLSFLDYLSEKNVRLIAVSDNYDTLKDEDDIIGIRTWVNERYSKELSQKIRFALKHKKKSGEYLAAFAPYGYKKSANCKNKLEIDSYASMIVREIFRLYIEGNGFVKIAEILESRGILNPSRYGLYGKRSEKWDPTTIRRIITNPVYIGDSVQQRYCKKTFKSKTMKKVPETGWIEVKNTHEPIISRETFALAKYILEKRKEGLVYRNGQYIPHLFSSFLYCHDCGSALYYKKDKSGKGTYRCGNYVKYGRRYCSTHFISEDELKNILKDMIISIIKENIDYQILYNDIANITSIKKPFIHEKKLKAIEEDINRSAQKIETIYKDKLNGIISEDLYIRMKNEIQALLLQQNKLRQSMMDIIEKEKAFYDRDKLISSIEGIVSMKNGVCRHVLERFVKRIEVYENGEITIMFNFFL